MCIDSYQDHNNITDKGALYLTRAEWPSLKEINLSTQETNRLQLHRRKRNSELSSSELAQVDLPFA